MKAKPSEFALEPFSELLREKIAELDAAEAPPTFVEDDPIDRLRFDARRCLQRVSSSARIARPTLKYPHLGADSL